MVKVLIGDMHKSKAQTLVNTVNCVGVMGKGIALQFKKRFPDMFEDYVRRCEAGLVQLGKPYLFKSLIPPWILNFPTKDHWRSVARLKDIINGLEYLKIHYKTWGIVSLAIPPLGCGEGQLEWRIVGPALYQALDNMDIEVYLYAPFNTPSEELRASFLDSEVGVSDKAAYIPPSRIQPAWLALVEILSRILAQPYHWPIGRTSFQKIAYFATELGIPTGLEYRKSSFGPYAPNLKGIITQLANNSLIVEERIGRMFEVRVGPTFASAQKTFSEDLDRWSRAVYLVADLFMRMRTSDAEMASTIHFATKHIVTPQLDIPSEIEVFTAVFKWKPNLNATNVATTIRNLAALGWLDVYPSEDLPIPDELIYESQFH